MLIPTVTYASPVESSQSFLLPYTAEGMHLTIVCVSLHLHATPDRVQRVTHGGGNGASCAPHEQVGNGTLWPVEINTAQVRAPSVLDGEGTLSEDKHDRMV